MARTNAVKPTEEEPALAVSLNEVVREVRARAGDRRRGALQAVVVHGVVEAIGQTRAVRWTNKDGSKGETEVRKFLVTCEGRRPSALEAERRREAKEEVQPSQQLWCEVRGIELCRKLDLIALGATIVRAVGQLAIDRKGVQTYVTARMYEVEFVD